MPRALTAALAAEFAKYRLSPVLFFELQFVSGWVRLFTGHGTITWNGQSWVGVMIPSAQIVAMVSSIVETTDVQAQGAKLTLSGVPAANLHQVMSETRQGFKANIYLGAFDQATGAVLADPYRSWSGYTDVPRVTRQGPTATIELTVESRLVDLQRARNFTYSHEDQQIFSPGDLGFEYVAKLQNFNVTWGSGSSSAAGSSGGLAPTPRSPRSGLTG